MISTTQRVTIDKVKDTVNNALLKLENGGTWFYWDIQEEKATTK